jgi:hypothetical protein
VYIGCSTHVVPSWSNVTMRACGATYFGSALSVVARTNSRIARLAGPSFQEGSGSVWACGAPATSSSAQSASTGTWRWFLRIGRCVMGASSGSM